jgi:hypothetical protein
MVSQKDARRASLAGMTGVTLLMVFLVSRWIPAFAGMT